MKIKDNSKIPKQYFETLPELTPRIADKKLETLEKEGIFIFPDMLKDANDITRDQMILQTMDDSYITSNVMGFLGRGDERLVIESRFSNGEHDYFFQYLLEKVLDIPNIIELNTSTNHSEQLFNMLPFLFPYYLKNALRKGIFKTYIFRQYNDNNIKGTIDIARHLRKNIPFTGNIAYNQREFSYDNYLMELIRHTIEFTKTKYYGKHILKSITKEAQSIVEITSNYKYFDRRKIIIENQKNPIQHAYYHEYRELQRLCIMILQHEKNHIGSGSKKIHGILFDSVWLWEEYINSLISTNFYHPMNKSGNGAQRLFHQSTNDRKIGLIYPDFISKNTTNRVIADAKYKPLKNIRNKDYLQVLAYMFRFDAKTGFYLYPEKDEIESQVLTLNSGSTYELNVSPRHDIQVIKHGLKIPSVTESYEEFKVIMKINESEFVSRIL